MSGHTTPIPMSSHSVGPLKGTAIIPGDKSVSHRSLILGALSVGETKISGLLLGQDVLDTAQAMSAFGASVIDHSQGNWSVHGVGVGGFSEPVDVIDCGNAGTGVRLIMGAMSTSPISATFTGDASLRSRPMGRITDPLKLFGAHAYGREKGFLPLTMVGARNAHGIKYTSPHPSAQIKSAILLSGLNALGETTSIEPEKTLDHSERMLSGFGADIDTVETKDGFEITLQGRPELIAQDIAVPCDPSSAAFPVCAALIVEGSEVFLPNIGLNPTRSGLFTTLVEMGANIEFENNRLEGGEPVADLRVKASSRSGIEVPTNRAPSMIDEYPILAVVAAFASGKTIMHGIKELRVKECDRIDAMARGLEAMGVTIEEGEDYLIVHGQNGDVEGGGIEQTQLDHHIAMSFLCMGLASKKSVKVDDGHAIATSFPIFKNLMSNLGASITG